MSEVVTVRMTRTQPGSANGVDLRDYLVGQTYDLPDDLARAFVEHIGCAVYADRTTDEPPRRGPGRPRGRGKSAPESPED